MRCQAMVWNNVVFYGSLGRNLNEIWIKTKQFPFKKMNSKLSFAKCRIFWYGLNAFMIWQLREHIAMPNSDISVHFCDTDFINTTALPNITVLTPFSATLYHHIASHHQCMLRSFMWLVFIDCSSKLCLQTPEKHTIYMVTIAEHRHDRKYR